MSTSTIRITSPGALAAAIPALLGFHPRRSLVVVLIRRHTVIVAARIDLPDDPEARVTDLLTPVLTAAARADADQVALAVHDARGTGDDLPHRTIVNIATEVLRGAGHEVLDALLIDGGRWWSYRCAGPDCCPREGTLIPGGITAIEAANVAAGRPAVSASRTERATLYAVRPDRAPDAAALNAAAATLPRALDQRARVALHHTIILAHANPASDPADPDVNTARAHLMLLLQDIPVRDYLLARLATDTGDLVPHAAAVTAIALSSPASLQAAVAATAAALVLVAGGDPVALDILIDLADGASLAALVQASASAGLPPDQVRSVFASCLPEVLQRFDQTG